MEVDERFHGIVRKHVGFLIVFLILQILELLWPEEVDRELVAASIEVLPESGPEADDGTAIAGAEVSG